MLGRPAPLWILGVLGMIGGLLCTIVAMQFAEVLPWAGEEATYIGGNWTGVLIYSVTALFFFAAGYAWLTVKPWAHMISILAALIGFFIPFISHMDGTDPRSSAIAPIVVAVLMLVMVFRPATNRAMAAALSGQGTEKTGKTPPPAKPMSAARKRELAAEQKKGKAPAPAPAPKPTPVTSAPAVASSPAIPVPAAVVSSLAAPTKTAASMVLSAASSLKAAAATPASPRKGVTAMVPGMTNTAPAPAPKPVASAPAQTGAQRVPGMRSDEV